MSGETSEQRRDREHKRLVRDVRSLRYLSDSIADRLQRLHDQDMQRRIAEIESTDV